MGLDCVALLDGLQYMAFFLFLILQAPLYAAAINGHSAVVEIFLKAGADVNKVYHLRNKF